MQYVTDKCARDYVSPCYISVLVAFTFVYNFGCYNITSRVSMLFQERYTTFSVNCHDPLCVADDIVSNIHETGLLIRGVCYQKIVTTAVTVTMFVEFLFVWYYTCVYYFGKVLHILSFTFFPNHCDITHGCLY